MLWEAFSNSFLDHFFPQELREAKIEDFVNLKKGRVTIKEYALKFHQLSKCALNLVDNMRERMRKFSSVLNQDLILENKTTLLIKDMDISRLTIHMQ